MIEQHSDVVFEKDTILKQTKENLVWAIDIYSKRKLMDSALRAKNYLADVLIYEQNNNEASELARDVSNLADDLNYSNIKYVANNPFAKGVIESNESERDSDKSHIELDGATIM